MVVGGRRQAPAALLPEERPGTHCTEGWVGPKFGLDGCGKSRPKRDSIPELSSPWRFAISTELFQVRPVLTLNVPVCSWAIVCVPSWVFLCYRSVYNLSSFVSGEEMASDHSSNKEIPKLSLHNFNKNRRISTSSVLTLR